MYKNEIYMIWILRKSTVLFRSKLIWKHVKDYYCNGRCIKHVKKLKDTHFFLNFTYERKYKLREYMWNYKILKLNKVKEI